MTDAGRAISTTIQELQQLGTATSSTIAGRNVLRTELTTFTVDTLKKDLERVLPQHACNATKIRWLQEYLRGYHPALQARVKTTRTDVDNKVTVDYAYSITRDIVGYFLGKPIQYTQRQGKYRVQMENLNNALNAENKNLVDYEVASDCSISGVGYKGTFAEENPRNGTHLKLMRLDPQTTFVVYPSDPVKPPAYAVTLYDRLTDDGTIRHYKVYTPNQMFLFKDKATTTLDTLNGASLEAVDAPTDISFGGGLPITEYRNNLWLMGDWEMAVSIMDALDAVASDGVNDIQQAVNSVLVAMGMELSVEQFKDLSVNGFLNVANIPQGVNPLVEFISQAMDSTVGMAMRDYLEATLRVVVGVPDRKTRGGGGGDTGDAVFMRDGWQDIDLVATAKEPYFIQAEREALAVALYVLDIYKEVGKIKATDIDIHFNRNKTANLQSKAQVFQILTTSGMDPSDALDIASLTYNIEDVILRMRKLAEENAKKRIEEAKASNTGTPDSGEGGASTAGDEDGTA